MRNKIVRNKLSDSMLVVKLLIPKFVKCITPSLSTEIQGALLTIESPLTVI